MQQFNRQAEVVFISETEEIRVRGLRVKFTSDKSVDSKAYNKTSIHIYNLNKQTRDKIEGINQYVLLNVGYSLDQNISLPRLTQGNLTMFKHSFEPPEILTELEFADGVVISSKRISYSGKQGVTPYQVLNSICKKIGVKSNIKALEKNTLANKAMAGGYSYAGRAADAIDELVDSIGSFWHIEDDTCTFLNDKEVLEGEIFLINEESGLIGVPTKVDDVTTRSGNLKRKDKKSGKKPTKIGYIVHCLLNPRIRTGAAIRVQSKKLNFDYQCKVERIEHNGDTHGNEWTSKIRVTIQ